MMDIIEPITNPTLEEQVTAALLRRTEKVYNLDVDENGNILIDKDKHPELYDWAVNG